MLNEVKEQHIINSLTIEASGTEHPSSPTPNVRKIGRPFGADLPDSAKKRKMQEHNRQSNERKKEEKHASRAKIAELEGHIVLLSGWATETSDVIESTSTSSRDSCKNSATKQTRGRGDEH